MSGENTTAARTDRLAGRRALVTGGDRGIGRAIAVRLAREGADVVIAYRSHEEEAENVRREIEGGGRRAATVQADVSDVGSMASLFGAARRALGEIDVLVNNAGVEQNTPFLDVEEKDYDRILATNLKGVFFATQAFAREWAQRSPKPDATTRPSARVINLSSVHEELPFPGFASYCAAKGGVRMLTRTLAIELAPLGIAVNAVAPGAIQTDINTALLRDRAKLDRLLSQIPRRRLGMPEDVAGVVAFLASNDADYVTGSTYLVDGGLTWFYEEQ